jgi:hypothetical protein
MKTAVNLYPDYLSYATFKIFILDVLYYLEFYAAGDFGQCCTVVGLFPGACTLDTACWSLPAVLTVD